MKASTFILLLFAANLNCLLSQSLTTKSDKKFTVAFYNVENFFDTIGDTLPGNNDFELGGERNWNAYRYSAKCKGIYKVITALEGWNNLALVGLAEIEGKNVIDDLITRTPLSKRKYKYCHYDSEDPRGIDVALIYDSSLFKVITSKRIEIIDENDKGFATRDILYVFGKAMDSDIHIFIVHFTSRYRGLVESQNKRLLCASVLKYNIDSIKKAYKNPNIIVMGDFNDSEDDKSLRYLLNESGGSLNHIKHVPMHGNAEGTLKYQHSWYTFDHILLSDALINGKSDIISDSITYIFDPDFLMEKDGKYNGLKPKRNYIGYKFNSGFSDHLPVYFHLHKVTNTSSK